MDELYINSLSNDQALKTLHKFVVSAFNYEGEVRVAASTEGGEQILTGLSIDTDHGTIQVWSTVLDGSPVLEIAALANVGDETEEEE